MLITFDEGLQTVEIPIANITKTRDSKSNTSTMLDGSDYTIDHYSKWVFSLSTPAIEVVDQAAIETALDYFSNREPLSFVHPHTGVIIYGALKGFWMPSNSALSKLTRYSFKVKEI